MNHNTFLQIRHTYGRSSWYLYSFFFRLRLLMRLLASDFGFDEINTWFCSSVPFLVSGFTFWLVKNFFWNNQRVIIHSIRQARFLNLKWIELFLTSVSEISSEFWENNSSWLVLIALIKCTFCLWLTNDLAPLNFYVRNGEIYQFIRPASKPEVKCRTAWQSWQESWGLLVCADELCFLKSFDETKGWNEI